MLIPFSEFRKARYQDREGAGMDIARDSLSPSVSPRSKLRAACLPPKHRKRNLSRWQERSTAPG